MKSYKEYIQDMDEVSKDLKKLEKNGRAIAASVIACLLEKQRMDEEKKVI